MGQTASIRFSQHGQESKIIKTPEPHGTHGEQNPGEAVYPPRQPVSGYT